MAHQRCAIHKCRNLQRHLAQRYRNKAHQRIKTALAQMSYTEVRQMLLELDAWLRAKNESATDSLLEAFEELLSLDRLKVPALFRETLMSTNPIESMFSLIMHSEPNVKRTRGSTMLQRWLGTGLLSYEGQLKKGKGYARMVQVLVAITVEQAEQQPTPVKMAA